MKGDVNMTPREKKVLVLNVLNWENFYTFSSTGRLLNLNVKDA